MRGIDWSKWSGLISTATTLALASASASSATATSSPFAIGLPDVELPVPAVEDYKKSRAKLPMENRALTPAAHRAMFSFFDADPSTSCGRRVELPPGLRYRPEDVPLRDVAVAEPVGVFRDAFGDLYAYAKEVIPKGHYVGW